MTIASSKQIKRLRIEEPFVKLDKSSEWFRSMSFTTKRGLFSKKIFVNSLDGNYILLITYMPKKEKLYKVKDVDRVVEIKIPSSIKNTRWELDS